MEVRSKKRARDEAPRASSSVKDGRGSASPKRARTHSDAPPPSLTRHVNKNKEEESAEEEEEEEESREEEEEEEVKHSEDDLDSDSDEAGPGLGFASALATILSKPEPVMGTLVAEEGNEKSIAADKAQRRSRRVLKEQRKLLQDKDRYIPQRAKEDWEREQKLKRTATAGVVQLFNAVKQQQQRTRGPRGSLAEKRSENLSKEKFLELLKNANDKQKDRAQEPVVEAAELEAEADKGEKPKWGVLSDTFMLGASYKKWKEGKTAEDQEIEDEDEQEEEEDDEDGRELEMESDDEGGAMEGLEEEDEGEDELEMESD